MVRINSEKMQEINQPEGHYECHLIDPMGVIQT